MLIVAREAGAIIGVVRHVIESGVHLLRGMQVKADYQRRGVGRQLLAAFEATLKDADCYCLPYDHLELFYSVIGFEKIEANLAPDFIHQRLNEYKERGLKVIVMMKKRGYGPRARNHL